MPEFEKNDGEYIVESTERQKKKNFRNIVAVQQMRAEQSRMALIEQANLSEEEIQQIDEIFDNLNSNLSEHSDDIWEFMEASRAGKVEEVDIYQLPHTIEWDFCMNPGKMNLKM